MTRPPINDTNSNEGLIGLGSITGDAPVAAFNVDQIESLLRTKGQKALHYRSALNPARTSLEMGVDVSLKAAQYGYIFYDVRELLVVPQRISLNQQLQLMGNYGTQAVGSVSATGNYTDGDKGPVYIKPNDLIVLNDGTTVLAEQLVEYNPSGALKLKFRAKGVDFLASEDTRFKEGFDFEVRDDGMIYWLGGRRPKFHDGKGQVLSVSYWIQPHYVVNSMPHILRVIPSNKQGSGALPRQTVYAPQQLLVVQSHLSDAVNYLDFFSLPDYTPPNDGPNTPRG